MFRLTIEIDAKGAAFADNPAGEIARLIEEASLRVTHNLREWNASERRESLFDVNGNQAGEYRVRSARRHGIEVMG